MVDEQMPKARSRRAPYKPGTDVEVRNRFDGTWSNGFVVADVTEDGGYLLSRKSDSRVLPSHFAAADVRRQRRSSGNWWF